MTNELEQKQINNPREKIISRIEESLDNLGPVFFDGDTREFLREALRQAGINLEIGDKEREKLTTHTQFRARVKLNQDGQVVGVWVYDRQRPKGERWADLEQIGDSELTDKTDRAAGVFAALGREKFEALIKWCYESAKESEYPGAIVVGGEPKEETRGRGLEQAAADLLTIALPNISDEHLNKVIMRFNERLWKGYQKTVKENERLAEIDKSFSALLLEELPEATLASFPPDKLLDLIKFLTSQ